MHYCQHYKRRWTGSGSIPTISQFTYANAVDATNGYTQSTVPASGDAFWNSQFGFYAAIAGLSNPATVYGAIGNPVVGLPAVGSGSGDSITTASPTAYPDLLARGLRALLPGIRPAKGLSLLNSIYELKDFKSLPMTIRRVRHFLEFRKGKFSLLSLARKFPRQTLKDAIRLSADVYLQKEFNIGPLLSDIAGVRTAISDVRQELARVLKNASRPIHSHWSCDIEAYRNVNETSSGTLTTPFVSKGISYTRSVYYDVKKFNVTLDYSYTLPPGVSQDSLLPALLDRFGVNLNPAIIWNAIPWSFVVDWVVNVSSWLSQFKVRNIEPQLIIRGCCSSVKVSRTTVVSGVCFSRAVVSATLWEESYERVPITVSRNSLLASGLSSHELSLLAALFAGRLR